MSNTKNRTKKLKSKLKKRGLELRKDSALCSLYINGKNDYDINWIVQRMCQMKYLYEYCDMKNIKSQVYNDYVTNGFNKNYEGTISIHAEKIALEKHSDGIYPKVFPWEINKINITKKFNNDISKLELNKLKELNTLTKFDENVSDDGEELDGGVINIYKIIKTIIIGYLFGFGLMVIMSRFK